MPFLFNISDFSLSINNVNTRLNGTSFKCILHGEAESATGYLTVLQQVSQYHTLTSVMIEPTVTIRSVSNFVDTSTEVLYTGIYLYQLLQLVCCFY